MSQQITYIKRKNFNKKNISEPADHLWKKECTLFPLGWSCCYLYLIWLKMTFWKFQFGLNIFDFQWNFIEFTGKALTFPKDFPVDCLFVFFLEISLKFYFFLNYFDFEFSYFSSFFRQLFLCFFCSFSFLSPLMIPTRSSSMVEPSPIKRSTFLVPLSSFIPGTIYLVNFINRSAG